MSAKLPFDKCILCMTGPAQSLEHFIPKSLGGRLRAAILCKPCNNWCGTKLVPGLLSDPSIRLALEHLKGELPLLYERAQDASQGLRFIGRAQDGSTVRASLKKGRLKVTAGPGLGGSCILDLQDAQQMVKGVLKKQGVPTAEQSEWLATLAAIEEDRQLVLPGGRALVKKTGPALTPELSGDFVDERVPVLVAYEFLALLIGEGIYEAVFEDIRQYLREGRPTGRVMVERARTEKYAVRHTIYVEPAEGGFTVVVRFFGWLAFAVRFVGYSYGVPDAVYVEDVKNQQGFFSLSRADARLATGWVV